MDVVRRHHRQLVVHDVRQLLDVEAARGDLGGDQQRHAPGLEVLERANPLRLRLVAVDRGRRDAVLPELLGKLVRAVLRAREDERLVHDPGPDEMREELPLA